MTPSHYSKASEDSPNMGSRRGILDRRRMPTPRLRSHECGLPWGLPCAYIVLLYFRNILRVEISREFTEAIIIIVLLTSVAAFATRSGPLQFQRSWAQICWALLFLGLIFLSAFAADTTPAAIMDSLYHVVSAFLTFWVFCELSRTRRGATALAVTLTVCAAANVGVGLWGAVTHHNLLAFGPASVLYADSFGFDASNGRSGGMIGENYTGLFDIPMIIAGLVYLRRRNRRWLGILLVLLGVGGAVVSASRASVLCVFIAIVTFAALTLHKVRLGSLIGAATVLFFIVCAGLLAYRVYLEQLPASTRHGINSRFSVAGTLGDSRRALLERYAVEVLSRPVLGHGPGYIKGMGDLEVVGNARIFIGNQIPHNSFIDVALEFGIPALIMFVIAMFRPLAAFTFARGNKRLAFLYACFLGMLIPLFTLSNPFLPIVWAMAGAVVGAVGYERQRLSPGRQVISEIKTYAESTHRRVRPLSRLPLCS